MKTENYFFGPIICSIFKAFTIISTLNPFLTAVLWHCTSGPPNYSEVLTVLLATHLHSSSWDHMPSTSSPFLPWIHKHSIFFSMVLWNILMIAANVFRAFKSNTLFSEHILLEQWILSNLVHPSIFPDVFFSFAFDMFILMGYLELQ